MTLTPHLCACGCGLEIPRHEGEGLQKWQRRRFASRACRTRGRKKFGRYDGGAQNPAEVMGARREYDLDNLPADEGRLWT